MLKPFTSFVLAASIAAPRCSAQLLDITPPGAAWARALSISDDGTVIAGSYSTSSSGPSQVFLWSAAGGYQFLPFSPDVPFRKVLVSGDGQAVAITCANGTGILWRGGNPETLTCGFCGAGSPVINGINHDGTRLAGSFGLSGATTWDVPIGGSASAALLLVPQANYTEASAISRDGLKIAGRSSSSGGPTFACVWDLSGPSPTVSTFPWEVTWPSSISGDGTVVAGNLHIGGGQTVAVRWSLTGTLEYLDPLGFTSLVLDTNNDGSSVVGWSYFPNQQSGAAMWTPATGMVDLKAYLPTIGISTSGFTLALAEAVSGDGRNIVGWGGNRAWLLRLPQTVATAAPFGVGCPSSGGTCTLSATTLPWVNATFQSLGTGLPQTSLVLTLTSLTSIPQGVVPLALAFTQAGPGCDVLVAPDILGAVSTTSGAAQSTMFLPNSPPLVGVTFFHQMVPFELDPLGAWISITSTNALRLTAGIF